MPFVVSGMEVRDITIDRKKRKFKLHLNELKDKGITTQVGVRL